MKNFKKVLSGFVALTMAMSANVISANASGSYLKGDVDGNGSVDLIDAITLVQFLNGSVGADGATAERMDVNRDYVINEYDRTILSSILLGDTNTSTLNSVNTTELPEQESRVYYKYTPNRMFQGTYTLDSVNNVSQTSPRCIIGDDDDRVPENGFEGVIKVNTSDGHGTAFVVDDHTILTAAHVLHNGNSIRNNIDFVIFDDYNTETNITITPEMYHIPQKYVSNTDDQAYDYAIVTVQEDLSNYINFNIGTMRTGMSTNDYVYVTGFGGRGNDIIDQDLVNTDLINVKSTGSGHILNRTDVGNFEIAYTVDTVGGDSGAPLYIYNSDGTKTVIGIHVRKDNRTYGYDYNEAIRITTNILNFIFNNTNL